MLSQEQGSSKVIEIHGQHTVYSISFVEDGTQVLSGAADGMLRRWRVDDGHEVVGRTMPTGGEILASALSPDRKWFACGLNRSNPNVRKGNVMVWDGQAPKKVLDTVTKGHTSKVCSVDFSPDSTKLATGGADQLAFIWGIPTGERLVGPLRHDGAVVAVRFSPSGDCIAIAAAENGSNANSIRIYNSGDGQQLLDIPFRVQIYISSPLAWSADGRQLFAVSYREVKRFDTSSGSLLSKWSAGGGYSASLALSHNQKFLVVSSNNSLSFWDTSTHKQIGTMISHASKVWSIALSPNDDCIATGEHNGRITFRNLHDILPRPYFTLNVSDSLVRVTYLIDHVQSPFLPFVLPLIYITDAVYNSWVAGDLSRVEELLTGELVHSSDPFYHACTLDNRALVRVRLGQWHMAIDDTKKSIKIQRSVIGHIANAMARVCNGEHDAALRAFDLAFSDGLVAERNFLLLIKAIILFECGKRGDAISRVDDLVDIVDEQSLYITVRAQMFLLLAGMSLREGDNDRATELLKRAREAIPFQKSPHLVVISLIFGWDFDKLALAVQHHLQECIKPIEGNADAALRSKNPEEAIQQYSTALTLDPLNPAGLLVKRSKARAMSESWGDALQDADEAIKVDPSSPWGYERRHAALHALQRHHEAVDAFTSMLSLIEQSPDQEIRQLGKKYILPSQSESAIESAVHGVFKICPIVLIDVDSGHLCDGPKRLMTFKSESQFFELVSSMTEELDVKRILQVVERYFQYVMFSHLWEGKEPSFQDVNLVTSIWNLDSSPLNEKLKKFCQLVREDGYRWAWSDTCCIDKTVSMVLSQSLTMMYKWYEASAATLVRLATIPSPSAHGGLTNSVWMTRAWTTQEALAPKVIRFYDRCWQPYLGDTRANHRDSPEIMQELADAIGLSRETVTAFNPDDLSVRDKLRLASTRQATVEEDVAYALIGIFKSDIRPQYGEGYAALGNLLGETVSRSGDVTVLFWTGKSSRYNSCLPATVAVYDRPPYAFPVIQEADMNERVTALRSSLSEADAMHIHDRVIRLPPVRFANRRLHLPCIIFPVKKLTVQDSGNDQESHYRARVSGIGHVDFRTSDSLQMEPRKLILVHPWIRDLHEPFDAFTWGNAADDDEDESNPGDDSGYESTVSSPSHIVSAAPMDDHTRALRLVVRLQQQFHALLLQQQRNGEFKRVGAEHDIVVPGIERSINFARDVRTEVVEIL